MASPPGRLRRWRKEAVDHLPGLFADPAAAAASAARQAEQVEALYSQICQLTTQAARLIKCGRDLGV